MDPLKKKLSFTLKKKVEVGPAADEFKAPPKKEDSHEFSLMEGGLVVGAPEEPELIIYCAPEDATLDKKRKSKNSRRHDFRKAIKLLPQEDQKALSAFITGNPVDVPAIPTLSDDEYQNGVQECPDFHANQFERVKVQDFGLAMLKGMGYDPESNKRHMQQHIELPRREHLLGLGAKSAFDPPSDDDEDEDEESPDTDKVKEANKKSTKGTITSAA